MMHLLLRVNLVLEDGLTSITVDFSSYISDLDDDLNIRTIPPSSGDNLNSVFCSEFIALVLLMLILILRA